ncbi:hypothetical protein NQ315_012223 [Exocentrus adspersus]|uniref:Uncharacterized protein n=1 Tax=Exocentrus adspersus TaxID=1586481 RepID=A0AAV8VAF8_9CUCU|nr:hypothetical protein NQ315_012223 [Exocentrus adspersus]
MYHRYIHFIIGGWLTCIQKTYRNPRKTNWEVYKTDLDTGLKATIRTIRSSIELEMLAGQVQDAIISAFNDNCPLVSKSSNKDIPWCNKDLANLRKQARIAFNKAKRTGLWEEYKQTLTTYNKALRLAKRESWRRHCEDIEGTPECARLLRILCKEPQSSIYTLKDESGNYTKTGGRL